MISVCAQPAHYDLRGFIVRGKLTRRSFLRDSGAGVGGCLLFGSAAAALGRGTTMAALDPASTPLKSLAESKGFLFGTSATPGDLKDPQFTSVVIQQCAFDGAPGSS